MPPVGMDVPEVLLRGTADAAALCYFAGIATLIAGHSASAKVAAQSAEHIQGTNHCCMPHLARSLSTVGCMLLVMHTLLAFELVHHWSHTLAYRDTARQTQELVGWNWGGGVYVNYTFILAWTADVGWSWLFPHSYSRRPAAGTLIWHSFALFIILNATVVFGGGFPRLLGLVGCTALAIVAWRAWHGARGEGLGARD